MIVNLDILDIPSRCTENATRRFSLPLSNLDHQPPPRSNVIRRFNSQSPDETKPVNPAVQRYAWIIIPYLGLKPRNFFRRNIRRIAHDKVKSRSLRQRRKGVATAKCYPIPDAVPGGVCPRHSQRRLGNINRRKPGSRTTQRQRNRNTATPRPNVQYRRRFNPRLFQPNPTLLRKQFRLRAGNENIPVHDNFISPKRNRPDQMLQRLAIPTPLHQLPQRRQLGFCKLPIEAQIQLQPRHPKHMRKQKLDLQSRRFDALSPQKLCALLDNFQHRHATRVSTAVLQQRKKPVRPARLEALVSNPTVCIRPCLALTPPQNLPLATRFFMPHIEPAMRFIRDVYASAKANGRPVVSFELFTPKTPEGERTLALKTLPALAGLKPGYCSVTYGAGGSTRHKTIDLVQSIQVNFGVPGMAHLTCIGATRDQILALLMDARQRGICNLLALRGDPPAGTTSFTPIPGGFRFAYELVELARKVGGFSVGVAGFPEGHIECREGKHVDWQRLKEKIDRGADFVITQLFFDNRFFYEFRDHLVRHLHVNVPIVPGIITILNASQIRKFTALSGASIPQTLIDKLHQLGDNDDAVAEFGIEFATQQCADLLRNGVPGIHFYTLNKARSVSRILANLGMADTESAANTRNAGPCPDREATLSSAAQNKTPTDRE